MSKFIPVIFIISLASILNASEWAMYRCDTAGTSHQSEVAYPPLTHKWSYNTFSPIIAAPIAAQGMVFVGNYAGAFYAFDAFSGEVAWQFSAEGRVDACACYYGGVVYFGTRAGNFYAVDADDGNLLWSKNLAGTIIAAPIVYEGKLYIGAGAPQTTLTALDPQTGADEGGITTLQPVQSSPCFWGVYGYISSNDGAVYRFNTSNLSETFKCQSLGSFELSSPLATEDGLYVSPNNDEKKLYRLDLNFIAGDIDTLKQDASGELSAVLVPNKTSSPSIANDSIFMSTGAVSVNLLALDAVDLDDELWSFYLGNADDEVKLSNPTLTQNCVYAVTFDGRLAVLDRLNGSLIDSENVSALSLHSQPAVSNGYVYIGSREGEVKAYKCAEILSIVSPCSGDVITNTSEITATAQIDNITTSEISYGAGENPAVWSIAASKQGAYENAEAGVFNAAGLADGLYTIKITAETSPASSRILQAKTIVNLNLPPEPPSAVFLTAVSGGVVVGWGLSPDDGAGDNDVSEYRIFRSETAASYSNPIAVVAAGVNTHTDTTLTAGLTYYFVVRAFDDLSESVNSNEASNLNTNETAWSKISASTGGQISLADGTKAVFPPGALDEDYWILIKTLHDGEYNSGGLDANYKQLGITRLFQVITQSNMQQLGQGNTTAQEKLINEFSNAVSFSKNVTVVLPYSSPATAIGDETKLRMLWYDEASSRWKIINTSAARPDSRTVTAEVSRFALYRIAEFVPLGELLDKSKVYTYPNPATGDSLKFKYYSGDDCFVFIDIYNVAGEKIAHLTGEGLAGLVSEINWDIKKFASGIYMYVVEAKSKNGSAKKKIVKKLAIIK